MKKRAYLHILFIMVAALFLGSCVKNEFEVTGELTGGSTRNLRFVYYASDSKRGFMMQSEVPSVGGKFALKGITRLPAMVWVIGPSGNVLTSFYARRGDKITISGEENSPASWSVSGNDINESLTGWRKANAGIISGAGPEKLNEEVARYVVANPDDVLSAALLLLHYSSGAGNSDFDRLWGSLGEDALDEELIHSVTGSGAPALLPVTDISVGQMQLYSIKDTLQSIDPSRYRASMIYFWRSDEGYRRRPEALRRLSEFASSGGRNCFVADVCLDADTLSWKRVVGTDSVGSGVERYWALGGEVNPSLLSLSLRSTPCVVVADRKGRVVYRGSDVGAAVIEAGKIK